MKITVFGVGSLGSLLGAYLVEVADVTLVGSWPTQLETIRTDGLTVVNQESRRQTYSVRVTNYEQLPGGQDAALIAVKSHQTQRAATAAAEALGQTGVAVTLQNGAGNLALLDQQIGSGCSTAAVTTQGANLIGPGVVEDTGKGLTQFGCRSSLSATAAQQVTELCRLFNEAGLEAVTVSNIDGLLWTKLAINAAINPLTALLEVNNGELLRHTGLRAIMTAAAQEAQVVATAQGIALPDDDPAALALRVAEQTAANRSSMLQDIQQGRPTEIDAICGAIVAAGNRHEIATPVNDRLLALVRQKETGQWRDQLNTGATLESILSFDVGGR